MATANQADVANFLGARFAKNIHNSMGSTQVYGLGGCSAIER
jgi:hypothetical protein